MPQLAAQPTNRRAEHAAETQQRLIDVARRLFAEHGYAGTRTEHLVAAAHMTRGALYHHYADKRDLFRAVFEHVEQELATRIAIAAAAVGDPWGQMLAGTRAFLDVCRDPAFARIVLIDGPSVLGWEEWRRIDSRYAFGIVRAALEANVAAGNLPPLAIVPLTHLYLGSLNEAALAIATAADPHAAVDEFLATLQAIMEAQRPRERSVSPQKQRRVSRTKPPCPDRRGR
jgi:AcrR family transcriptional regulator